MLTSLVPLVGNASRHDKEVLFVDPKEGCEGVERETSTLNGSFRPFPQLTLTNLRSLPSWPV